MIKLSKGYSNVPGPKHDVAMLFIELWVKKLSVKGWRYLIEPEKVFINGIRADVFVEYFKPGKSFKVIYECQTNLKEGNFIKKVERIKSMIEFEERFDDGYREHKVDEIIVIPVERMPNDINKAYKWVKDWVILP